MIRVLQKSGLALGLVSLLAACPPAQPTYPQGGGVAPTDPTLNLPVSQTGWSTFTNRTVSVYQGRSAGTYRLGTLPAGTTVEVYGSNAGWTLVRLDTGQRGWVESRYLGRRKVTRPRPARPATPAPPRTPAGGGGTPPPDPDVVVDVCADGDPNCAPAGGGGAAALPGQ